MAFDMGWAWEQMKAAGTLHPIAVDVEKLLTTWNKLSNTEVSAASVLDTFNSLARGHGEAPTKAAPRRTHPFPSYLSDAVERRSGNLM